MVQSSYETLTDILILTDMTDRPVTVYDFRTSPLCTKQEADIPWTVTIGDWAYTMTPHGIVADEPVRFDPLDVCDDGLGTITHLQDTPAGVLRTIHQILTEGR